MRGILVALCAAAAACTPKLAGQCSVSADCQAGETCSPDGLCLRSQGTQSTDGGDAGTDGGGTDGGGTDGGAPASTIDLLTPASGATMAGHFHVSAQSDSTNLAAGVDFNVTNAVGGAMLGQLSVATPAANVWSGDLTLSDSAFGGGAKVTAVLHRTGLSDVVSSAVPVVVDQSAPSIDSFDAGGWSARDAGLLVVASVSDDRTGVASATLTLPDGGTYAATLVGSLAAAATFHVPAADVVAAGHAASVPFSLAASDAVGNRAGRPDASVLEVDDEPPAIGIVAPDPLLWRAGALDLAAVIGDGKGSGVATTSLTIGGASIAGLPDAGSAYTFHADLPTLFPATEGPVALQIVAVDAVGNSADAGYSILVDDVPPSFAPSIATAADYTDSGGTRWFKAGAGTITVQAAIDAGAGSPLDDSSLSATFTGGSAVAGGSGPFTFAIPRALGAGVEGAQHVALQGRDTAGNAGGAGIDIDFDDVPPAVSADTSNPANTAWHSADAGNLSFTASAVITDQGSGVASASLGGTAGAAGASAWQFGVTLPSTATLENAAYPLALLAKDNIGNQTSGQLTFAVDNSPPSVSSAQVDTAFDGTDSASQGWFQGPTACPACGAVQVSAVISDGYLVASSVVAKAGGNSYPGTLVSGRWQFQLPRSLGLHAAAALAVAFDAQDLAGNHPVSPPALSLQFDDVPASAFKPAVAADATWYARAAGVKPSVAVTIGTPPRSGMSSMALKVSGQSDIACAANSATSYTCVLPSTYAPAASEAALDFSVQAASVTKISSSNTGARNFDDLPPVFTNVVAAPYPAAAADATSWGHDGAHFTLRDSGTLYSFTVYDCGAGVGSITATSVAPSLGTHGQGSLAAYGPAHACANGNNATVYKVDVTGNLATSAAGAFTAMDDSVTVGATVADAASGQAHTQSSSTTVAVTRRLWHAALGVSVGELALGPNLFAAGIGGLYGFNPVNGGQSTWSTKGSSLGSVAPNAGTPAVLYSQGFTVYADNAAGPGNFGSCPVTGGNGIASPSLASGSSGVTTSDTRGAVSCGSQTDPNGCFQLCCAGAYACSNNSCLFNPCNCATYAYTYYTDSLNLSGSTVSCAAGGTQGTVCSGVAGSGLSYAVSIPNLYVGSNGSTWVAENGAGTVLNTWGGAITSGHGWPMIDGSNPAVAYLPDVAGGGIDAVQLGASGFVGRLYNLSPPFPAVVADMALSAAGVLYVLSGNNVYAILTDSTGALSTQASAWPAQCHDPCRSSLAGYACPY